MGKVGDRFNWTDIKGSGGNTNMVSTIETIAEQLTDIYINHEYWHTHKMDYETALQYHQAGLDNGSISIYVEDGELLGYYQRYFDGNTCYFMNTYIKPDYRFVKVYKYLKRLFLSTMPKNIDTIVGEKQKLGGKFQIVSLKKGKKYGND